MNNLKNPLKIWINTIYWSSFLLSCSHQVEFTNSGLAPSLDCDQWPCPIGRNGNFCSGHGQCNCSQQLAWSCNCENGWLGPACQYELQSLTCENLRACIQCRVHGTGPLSEDKDCKVFCTEYPHPIVVTKFYFKPHEVLCSFMDNSDSTECRFWFKIGNFGKSRLRSSTFERQKLEDQRLDLNRDYYDPNWNKDVFIVAQKDKQCKLDSTSRIRFPYSTIVNSDSTKEPRNEEDGMQYMEIEEIGSENTSNGYTTVMILFIFIVLPFVSCFISCFIKISTLPCGLCNIFRRPSSTCFQNSRPGIIVVPSSSSEV